MDIFRLDLVHWPELAADRGALRAMLQCGEAPPGLRQAPAPTPRGRRQRHDARGEVFTVSCVFSGGKN